MMRPLMFLALAGALGAQAPRPERDLNQLKAFYQQACARCHGADGTARDATGRKLGGRDFTNARDMKGETDAGMAKTVRKGIFFGKVMPAFKDQLSEAEALRMIQEIVRKAKPGAVIAPAPAEGSR